jgi:hypothetical protein
MEGTAARIWGPGNGSTMTVPLLRSAQQGRASPKAKLNWAPISLDAMHAAAP